MKIKSLFTIMIPLILAVCIVLTACEKPYPDDIPKWLKKKIKTMDEHTLYHLMNITELKSDSISSFIYLFQYDDCLNNDCKVYYDYNGNFQCMGTFDFENYCDTCGNIAYFKSYQYYRIIFSPY